MSALREQFHILSTDVVRVKSAGASNANPTSEISKSFCKSPSQIAHHDV